MLRNVKTDQVVVRTAVLVDVVDQIVTVVDRLNHVAGILLEEAKTVQDPEKFEELSSSIKDIFDVGNEAGRLGHTIMDIVRGK